MNSVKLQCPCGQRYAFDVEAPDGQMPYSVACPVCGADGTDAANRILSQSHLNVTSLATDTVSAREGTVAGPVRIELAKAAVSSMASRTGRLMPGQVARPQALQEARAKIFWGDAPEEVVKFLMRQNIPYSEASELVKELSNERAAALRSEGIGKIVTGIGMACVPMAAWTFFTKIGFLPLKLFALTVMVGCWGAYRIIKGTLMVVSPRSESGDVAEQ
jgi:hypothetical protein